ncbi:MAG: hypothetical protein IJA86_01970 [Clostridia bacterium]|nr:hypothetical protein [Clostridia bacterium]
MKQFYFYALQGAQNLLQRGMRNIIRDFSNPYYGKIFADNGLFEPGSSFVYMECAITLYVCPDSTYYKKPSVREFIHLLCAGVEDSIHEDGTDDLIISNYHQPEFFNMPHICYAYRLLRDFPEKTEAENEIAEKIYHLLERLSQGLLSSGFHTPNHRWVHTAALYYAYNTLREKDERLLHRAKQYLAEKIDIDENGEFSERSAGMYSAVSDRALCQIAMEANMPELFELVKKNLLLVSRFIEKGTLIFTQNSRRKDKGEVGSNTLFDFERYTDICLMAYANTKDLSFLGILKNGLSGKPANAVIHSPLRLYMLYPELRNISVNFSLLPPPEKEFHLFYPQSGIVRVKKNGVIYSLLARNPDFMHITVGNISIRARICSSFFAIAQFLPDAIEKIGENQYRMSFHTRADYKLPFDTPPEGSENYWSMDYNSRQSICRCDFGYTVDFSFTETGLKIHIQTHGMEKVPFKLEIAVPTDVYIRAGSAMTVATAGNFLCASEGDVSLSNPEGDSLTVKNVFAKHFYHRNMRGSVPSPCDKYLLFLTDFSPVDRTVEIICERNRPLDYFCHFEENQKYKN